MTLTYGDDNKLEFTFHRETGYIRTDTIVEDMVIRDEAAHEFNAYSKIILYLETCFQQNPPNTAMWCRVIRHIIGASPVAEVRL